MTRDDEPPLDSAAEREQLYREVLLDHSRHPRNFRKMPGATHTAEGDNPLCGDRLAVYVRIDDGVIRDLAFEGRGCAIDTASASLMTETLIGQPVEAARVLFEQFHAALTGPPDEALGAAAEAQLGKLAAFHGVRRYPVRVKCATLPWHTLQAALRGEAAPVSTE